MKSEIFIFFVLCFCFNTVAPYQKYADFRQGSYQPQNYPPNPSPVYPAHRPAVINYESPQQVANYLPSPSQAKYVIEQDTRHQDRKPEELPVAIQQKVIEKQSDAIFEEQTPSQIYPERPSLYIAPALPQRNYDTYGQAYPNIYPTQGPRHWGNAYQPNFAVQEPYREGAVIAYPQWQSRAYKAIPRQNEYYGDSYTRQNAYNKPVQYISQPLQSKHAQTLSGAEKKTPPVQPQYEHNRSPLRQNTYKTPFQYIARPEQIKAEEVFEKEVVKQNNEFHQNPQNEYTAVHNVPVRYPAHLHKADPIKAPPVPETKIQPTVFQQQESEYYGSPYEQKYVQNVPVQYEDQLLQAKPVEVSSISETKIQPVQPENVNYESHHQKPARDVLVEYVESQRAKPVEVSLGSDSGTQPIQHDESPYKRKYVQNVEVPYESQTLQVKPVEVPSVSETKIQPVQQDEYYESPYDQKYIQNVPVQHEKEPQQANPVEVSLVFETKTQPIRQVEYYESPSEQTNVHDVKYVAEPQEAKPVEGSEIKIQPVQDKIYSDSRDEQPNTSNVPEQFTPQPLKGQPVVQRPLVSETLTLEKLANRPEVIDFLASTSQKKRYLIFHQNGTVEHVDSVHDSLLDNSHYFKSNDLRLRPIKHRDIPLENTTGPTISTPYNYKPKHNTLPWITQNRNPTKDKSKIIGTFEVNDQNTHPYKPLATNSGQPNSELNYSSSSIEAAGLNKYRNPTGIHRLSDNNKDYYPEHKNSNNPSQIQTNLNDDNKPPLEYVETPVAYYAKDTDVFNRFVEPTTTDLPFKSKNIQNKSDIINIYPENEHKTSNILDSFAQKGPQETNNDTSSNVQNHPGNTNVSTVELKNLTNEVSIIKNNTNYEYTNVTDADNNNDRTVNETTPSTTDMQDTNIESNNDDDIDRSSIEVNTEHIINTQITSEDEALSSPAADTTSLSPAKDKTTLSSVEPLDIEPLDTEPAIDEVENAEEEEQPIEDVILIEDLTTENQLGENEVVVDKAFWDAVYSTNDTGGFNELFIFNVNVNEPVIEKNSRSYVLANGTHVEETEEIIWEHKSDVVPRETKYTRITKNYDPESSVEKKSKPPKDAKTSKCKHHKT